MIRAKVTESHGVLKCTIHSARPSLKGRVYITRSSGLDTYSGEYIITPMPFASQTLETNNKIMQDDVTVLAIPYYETSNISGKTVYIGGE